MATAYDCKFIETSVGINHNVDELLVGLLTQIRLKLENPEKSRYLILKAIFFYVAMMKFTFNYLSQGFISKAVDEKI